MTRTSPGPSGAPEAEAVADAGPLIHLDEVGFPEGLECFRRVTVPHPVVDELRIQPRGPGNRLLRKSHLHMAAPSREEVAVAEGLVLRRLSRADRIALAMAQSRDATLLSDDIDVRDGARALGVAATGTVGLVVRAARLGIVTRDEAVAALDRILAASTLFVTQPLLDRAKAAL